MFTSPVGFDSALDLCVDKARANLARLAATSKSGAFAADGDYFAFDEGFFEISNWTSSFFTGMALLAYEKTRDPSLLEECRRLEARYRDKVTMHAMETMHDLGFLYSLYSVALHKLTGDPAGRATGLQAADELAKRFIPTGGYIRAWGRMDEPDTEYAGLAIIDCLMNLPLLFWAAQETGSAHYRDIAVRHADTVLANFIRPDGAVFHSFRFDLKTGRPAGAANYCGYAIHSDWARGSTWAIYGFAVVYGYTHDRRYLDCAKRVATKFIHALDAEVVPVWDFRLPAGDPKLRDSSAAAIAASGFLELLKHFPGDEELAAAADRLLARLASEDYLNSDPACPGLLRFGEVGDGIGRARTAYTSWGDYFFMEALMKRAGSTVGFW